MNVRRLRILISLLILLIGLTACEGEGEARVPLDPSSWPTPLPSVERPTATPFPRVADAESTEAQAVVQVEATATPEPTATLTTTVVETTTTTVEAEPTATAEANEASEANAAVTPTAMGAEATSTTSPTESTTVNATDATASVGYVSSYGLNMRQGAGPGFEVVVQLGQGDEVTLLDRDEASGWINIQTADGLSGWVNPEFVDFAGKVEPVSANIGNNNEQAAQVIQTSQSAAPAVPAASQAEPQPQSDGSERLVIQLASGGDIMVINRDGIGLRRLTAGIDPALSPDGSKVAFTRWDSGNQGFVWTINMDGSGETRVIGGARQAKSPTWSPDGTQIAINYQEGGTLDPVEKCQDFVDGEPDFNFWIAYDFRIKYQTINGQKIPVAICWTYPPDAHWGLRVIDVQAQSYEDMPSSLYTFGPAWDPANAWRVVSSGRQGLVWTDVLRGVSEPLTDDPSDRGPAFSPDGQYMALTYLQADHWEIHRLNADGSGRVRLTKLPLYAVAEDIKTWNNASPTFSPDGSEIAFVTDRTGRWEIWVMNVDGSNQRPMFSDEINDQLPIQYDNNDERVVRWGS